MSHPIVIGQPLPRAGHAYIEPQKLIWLLSGRHGQEFARVFRIGPSEAGRLWTAIAVGVRSAPVISVRDVHDGTAGCRVDVILTLGERRARVRTAWHYAYGNAAPRLVTAFPKL